MIQEIAPKKFDNAYKDIEAKTTDVVFVFAGEVKRKDKVLVRHHGDEVTFPTRGMLEDAGITGDIRFLFSIDDENFFMLTGNNVGKDDELLVEYCFDGFEFKRPKVLRNCNPQHHCFAAMTAYHLYQWRRDNRYCGKCGGGMHHVKGKRELVCEKCGNVIYPAIAPAVIIGLTDGDKLLLSVYAGREYKGRALLAGFCEIGETPEETVVREVMEEVGLKATNVRYFGSQPWGFDINLLLGYFADVEGSREITLDTEELQKAVWMKREDIEYEPNLMSLTATMIEAFRKGEV